MALINEPATKNDPYGWLGLASLNFASAPSQRKKVRLKHPHVMYQRLLPGHKLSIACFIREH